MDTLLLVIFGAFCFYAGWLVKSFVMLARIGNDPEHFIKVLERIKEVNAKEELEERIKAKGTELTIEKHHDMLYAFAQGTDEFIAQGTDLKSVLESAHKRFPGRIFFGEIPADSPAKELAKL